MNDDIFFLNYHLKFIKSYIKTISSNWLTEEDIFTTLTSTNGKVKFRNIITTYVANNSQLCGSGGSKFRSNSNNNNIKRIVLACHYDSLHPSLAMKDNNNKNNQKYIGATDAAVSCSILLSLAKFITPYLDKISESVVRKKNL